MKKYKCLKIALNMLFHSKLRSWLTIIGIVIGVASVVSIVSIGEGMQANVQSRLSNLGADLITISAGFNRAQSGFRGFEMHDETTSSKPLTNKDLQILKGISNIKSINTVLSGKAKAYFLGQSSTVDISGVDPIAWTDATVSELEIGRLLNPSDTDAIILGSRIAKKLFKEIIGINKRIEINGKNFLVVGILKESGNGFGGDDNKIIMTINSAKNILEDIDKNSFSNIIVKVTDADIVDLVLSDIENKLIISRHVNNRTKDFTVASSKSTQERISSVTDTITIFLGAIAFVSLIVGAVGIANTMFTSVMEKTKDIGIMKAIGAGNYDILLIFIFNAGLVGLTGGVIGVILGSTISFLIPSLGMRFMGGAGGGEMTTVITMRLLLISLLLSLIIGIISGIVPAYRASKLKPVDALRHE